VTGSIGFHIVNTAIKMGYQPVALVRNKRKVKSLPRETDVFYGDVLLPETLSDLPKDEAEGRCALSLVQPSSGFC